MATKMVRVNRSVEVGDLITGDDIMPLHTPTPWETDIEDAGTIQCRNVYGQNGEFIAEFDCGLAAPVTEANAIFAVKAVNAHDALVAALDIVASSGKFNCFDDAAWDTVNDALALARGGKR